MDSDPMPVMDRQPVPSRRDGRSEPPQRVPETSPPLLGDWFIYLSVIILVCGVIVITALNFGAGPANGIVRFPALIGAGILVIVSADAAVRTYRSIGAWWNVDRPRAVFRVVWSVVLAGILVASVALIYVLLTT
ncbi:MAG TPA: hypothetical protein VMZ33_04810 [Candidatus Limnocylindrales bacterium]|nr:hypothetical protein [Candidatus Limnocylindrales bacterium]